MISRTGKWQALYGLCSLVLLLCEPLEAVEPLRAVATTSLLGCAASRIGGDRVHVTVLVPPGACPSHFDMKPSEAKSIEDCDVLLRHGFEAFLPNTFPGTVRCVNIQPSANGMTPEAQAEIAKIVTRAFSKERPGWEPYFHDRLNSYQAELKETGREITEEAKEAGVRDIPVAVSVRIEGFFRWMGFKKILPFGIPEEITPRIMVKLIERAKEMKVALVADNLQSGSDTGLPIAKETGAEHLVLRFFPGKDGFIETVRQNAGTVLKGIRKWKKKRSQNSGG